MDEQWIDEWMSKQMDKQVDKHMNKRLVALKKGQMDRLCQEKCVSKFSKNN